jgi:hypothetical protein
MSTTTYPTVAALQAANFDTLCAWCDNLPPPQTDVEHTVHRRLFKQRAQVAGQTLRRDHPEVADKLSNLHDLLRKIVDPKTAA